MLAAKANAIYSSGSCAASCQLLCVAGCVGGCFGFVSLVCVFMAFSSLDWGSGFIWIGNDIF